jgi:hypothetical protein
MVGLISRIIGLILAQEKSNDFASCHCFLVLEKE